MDADYPIIAYDNLLSTADVRLRIGALDGASSLDKLWNDDLLRPCFFQSSGGVVELGIYTTSPINCCIIGQDRNDSAGQLVGVGGVTVTAYTNDVGFGHGGFGQGGFGGYNPIKTKTFTVAGTQRSKLLRFDTTCNLLVITFTGCDAAVAIPEIFVGKALKMPLLSYGFDPYLESTNISLFQAESGREYSRLRFRRIELNPQWANVPHTMWTDIDTFRERALETRSPFWFAWAPTAYPEDVFQVRHVDGTAPFPIQRALYRRFALKLQEVI